MSVPILESERLRFRGHAIEDFEHCVSLWTDPVVTRYITGVPLTREECWTRLLRYVGHWTLLGFGYWIAEEKDTGVFVGEVGFADYKREVAASVSGVPEVGWVLAAWAHGKGYATEAVQTILAWGEANLECDHTVCFIHPQNQKSMRVAEKCGFRRESTTLYKGSPTVVFARQGSPR